MNKVFFHVDLDAFFASVEQLDHPEYRGKPVIVGGEIGDRRSVVSTASYEARKFGVHSAMPTFQAVKLCPHGIFIHGNMRRYQEKSREVMSIFSNYSPDVQQMSVDEAFIDMTGTEKLFGKPVDAAKMLKAEVLEKTGLTVSIGIASTKYCAKIASGMKKPDGLYEIPYGKEEEFILSLPLDKLWGVGKKTQEKLLNFGIKTPYEIHQRSAGLLQSLFGNASGLFLYKAVRGCEYEDFNTPPKSRSISSETTYEYDLENSDSIETALLELCHTVMFRSLKEKVRSRSISLKIRYEDFSTVSVQETSERYVSSVDDLFDRVKILFQKKSSDRMGIRLFGVSLQNIEDDTKPRPTELFDFGEEKKRKLEQAILKAEQKDPSIKISKARLLKTGLSVFMFFFAGSFLKPAWALTNSSSEKKADGAGAITFDTSKLPVEDFSDSTSLFKKNFFGKEIEFLAEGYWQSSVKATGSYSFGYGTTPGLLTPTPVFEQNVDLTLWFLLNKKWYFEAAFADNFEKNTVAAGYNGDGYLKSFRIGNRKITFPDYYTLSDFNRGIGGGENQAPGISANFKGEKWSSDFAVRYDLLSNHSKSWYGKNAVSTNYIQLTSFLTGTRFVLPEYFLKKNIRNIYVESAEGDFKDSKGRIYKKLNSTEYILLSQENTLILSKDAKSSRQDGNLPAVAVSFYSALQVQEIENAAHFKNDIETPCEESLKLFFEDVSECFDSVQIDKFYYNFTSEIESNSVLFIQHPSGFSPFLDASVYDAGIISINDTSISHTSTGTINSDFTAIVTEEESSTSTVDFFYDTHTYIHVFKTNLKGTARDKRAEIRFPFADTDPGIYLSTGRKNDLALRTRTYSPVKRLDIGTKAVPGTITVYKNNIIDSGASYNPSSGEVTLSTSVSSTDHIKVMWQEESQDAQNSAFALAAGYKYDFTENLNADIGISSRLSYRNHQEYADYSISNPQNATIAAGIEYKNESFKVKNSSAFSFDNHDSTGTYRILGMDDGESDTYYLPKTAGKKIPYSITPVLNARSDTVAPGDFPELEQNANKALDAENGVTDSAISGYSIPFAWQFEEKTSAPSEPYQWAAETITLGAAKSVLSAVSKFNFAIKNPFPDNNEFDLYLQLGVSNNEDMTGEDGEKIPTWKISSPSSPDVTSPFKTGQPGWQIVTVVLSDSDRAFLSNTADYSARLIVVPKNNTVSQGKTSGGLFAGPYEFNISSFITNEVSNISLSSHQSTDYSLISSKIKDFNPDSENKVQNFNFRFNSNSESKVSVSKYFSPVDLKSYKKLNFYFKMSTPSEAKVKFIMDTINDDGHKTSLYFELPSSKISQNWQKIEVNLDTRKVSCNFNETMAFTDTSVTPSRFALQIEWDSPVQDTAGSFSIDEIFLSDSKIFYNVQDKLQLEYIKKEIRFSDFEKPFMENLKLSAEGNTSSSIDADSRSSENTASAAAQAGADISGFKVLLSAAGDSNADHKLTSASHNFSTTRPLFKTISFSEGYNFDSSSKVLEKENSAEIDFSAFSIPFSISGKSKSHMDSWAQDQELNSQASAKIKAFTVSAKAQASQKISFSNTDEDFEPSNYFVSWSDAVKFEFSRGDLNADKRKVNLSSSIKYKSFSGRFSPSLEFQSSGNYKNASSTTFSDEAKLKLSLPYSMEKHSIIFSWTKISGSLNYTEAGGNYAQDFRNLFSAMNKKKYFFNSIPVHDLMSKHLETQVKDASSEIEDDSFNVYYATEYSLGWKRQFSGTKTDAVIPSSASLSYTRDIKSSKTTSDIYQLKGTVSHTAMNLFGKTGTIPVFSFYEQDELLSSLSTALKIPKNNTSGTKVKINGYNQLTLYFNTTDFFRTGIEGSFESRKNWDGKSTFVWKRNGKNSISSGLYRLFRPQENKWLKITKTDSLNVSAASSASTKEVTRKFEIDYTHKTDTQLTRYFIFNSSAGIGYNTTINKIAMLNASLTLGATLKF